MLNFRLIRFIQALYLVQSEHLLMAMEVVLKLEWGYVTAVSACDYIEQAHHYLSFGENDFNLLC